MITNAVGAMIKNAVGAASAAILVFLATAIAMLPAVAAPPGYERPIIGKPTGPIAIRYELAAPPALGRPVEVTITVESDWPLRNVAVSLVPSEGLALDASQAAARIARIEPGEPYRTTVAVTPLALDILYLTVTVEADVNGTRQGRTLMVPLRLAEAKSRAAATIKADLAGGNVVHSLPATPRPSERLR